MVFGGGNYVCHLMGMDQTPKYSGRPLGPSGMQLSQLESCGNRVGIMLGHVTSLGGLVH